jgi:hypothetical protein
MNYFLQQGDVLIIPIENFESRKKSVKKSGDVILAEGETTGHAHRIKQNEFVECYDDLEEKCLILRLLKPAKVKHEEHKEIEIPAGDFKIDKVLEYDHFAEESRFVAD